MLFLKKRAFTLIELLVVIAIIAILAAILFPVFAQARETARAATCASNMNQIGKAILMYVQDYDERYPLQRFGLAGNPPSPFGTYPNNNFGWNEAVHPYVKNTQAFKCASADDRPIATTDDSERTAAIQVALNGKIPGQNLATLSFPASTILLSEASRATSDGSTSDEAGEWGWNGTHQQRTVSDGSDGGAKPPLRRHKDGANYTFADGHVKWYQYQQSMKVYDVTNTGGVPANRTGQTITYFLN
jgi:prepilin-type N-terminal cleavage/methylation domain-containing protein/prepilin-type processing-associated H-X9-DG protein